MNSTTELPRTVGLSRRFPTPFLMLGSFKAALTLPILSASVLATFGCLALGIPSPSSAIHEGLRILNDFFLSIDVSCGSRLSAVLNWPDVLGLASRVESPPGSEIGLIPWLFSALELDSAPLTALIKMALPVLMSVLLWTFVGLAIQRIAVVRLATGDSRSLYRGLKWAKSKYRAFWGSAFIVVFTAGLACLIPWVGLQIPYLSGWLFPIWCFWLLAGMIITAGAVLGLPFLGAALVAQNGDAYDAASRAFSYSMQKPLSLVCCLFWVFVWGAAGLWFLAAILKIGLTVALSQTTDSSVLPFWIFCLNRIPEVILNAYVFSATAGIYLIQRFKVDDEELDEVYLSTPYGLPRHQLPDFGPPSK